MRALGRRGLGGGKGVIAGAREGRLLGVARERDGAALNSRRFLTLTGQSR